MSILIFLITLLLTFFSARRVQNNFYILFYRLTIKKTLASYLTWILFLPGVFVHELSHYLTALILGVRTGKFVLLPQIVEGRIILGHVEIAKTDIIRRFIIGIAPLVIGVTVLFFIVQQSTGIDFLNDKLTLFLFAFLVFEIVNTMFLSKEDMKGSWRVLIPMLAIGVTYLYYITGGNAENIVRIPEIVGAGGSFEMGILFLLPPLTLNILILLITKTLNRISQ